jgi:MFS family permease
MMSSVLNSPRLASLRDHEMPVTGILDKKRTVAGPGFNRWIVPPAALAVHLCIGMAYGFSVFWLPLSRELSIAGMGSGSCPPEMSFISEMFTTACDWRVSSLGWIYTLFFIFLGCAAAAWGGWLERVGPRKAGVVSALCWCGGMLVSSLGISMHQLWLLLLGSGVIGGVGLGIGYISPVSTLIKWFPDRRGMATGMAIMGFGGGAMIGSPLAVDLMKTFGGPTSTGVLGTFLTLALVYFVFMLGGAFGYRVPGETHRLPAGSAASQSSAPATAPQHHVQVKKVWGIPQFWLVWLALCMNVSAGIGVIGMASPMLQEVFGGSLIGVQKHFTELDKAQLGAVAAVAGGFAALLSLFNIGGRLFWASLSDKLGRKNTFMVFFILGGTLYALLPAAATSGDKLLFVSAVCLIVSMYGGGFSTVPAYLADLFGTRFVGAIHGRLLTAWATAGILGPVIVNYMREYQLGLGIAHEQVYNQTMFILVGMLAVGFVANLLIRPVHPKWFMTDEQLAAEGLLVATSSAAGAIGEAAARAAEKKTSVVMLFLAWLVVGVPLAWGAYRTVQTATKFFS